MPTVIPVKFAYATRDLWFDPGETGAIGGDHVICATDRGTEIGLATADPCEVDKAELSRRTGDAGLKRVLRIATDADLDRASDLVDRGDRAFPTFRRLVSRAGLDMKPVGVEYLFGGEKVVCYFSAEERVDFRQLVRDLARELHERVDMRQIGVREEAALMGGFAHCGQELCCTRFGSGFEPVSIRMAKEQDLPLNSNKISGACGRLMCCLRYEFEAYRDFKQRAPKKNAVIQTPLGTAKIIEYDTPKEQICLRLENGKQVRVPLAEMEASPAACKKSEELGCKCRPDTVTRSTLEKLNSPEIRAALEEIDRKNGLIPEEGYDAGDIFVEERGRKRRNKGGNKGGAAAGGTVGVSRSDAGQGRARAAGDAREGRQDGKRGFYPQRGEGRRPGAAAMEALEAEPLTGVRRRHRKTVEVTEEVAERLPGQGDMAKAKQSAPGEGRRSRRRRHHVEGEAPEQDGRQQRGAGAQRDERGGEGAPDGGAPRRRRRRPGDKGGAAAEQRGAEQGSRSERQPRERRDQHGESERSQRAGQQHRDAVEQPSDGAPKRRRRRHKRGGSGEGGGPADGPGSPSAGSDA